MRRWGSEGPDVARGLMLAMLRPPAGKDMEFNWWYDTEHAPIRWGVPGFLTARRYQAVAGWDGGARMNPELRAEEEAEPRRYLAYYDLDDVDVLNGRAYLSWEELATPNGREMLANLCGNDRRVYEVTPVADAVANSTDLRICAPFIMATWWNLREDCVEEFEEWYEHEHVPMLMRVPGWLRIRRFQRIDQGYLEPGRKEYFAIHDLASLGVFAEPSHAAAGNTPWRTRATSGRSNFTRRLYRLWRQFD